jgi:hypothetical protein
MQIILPLSFLKGLEYLKHQGGELLGAQVQGLDTPA